MKFLYTLFILVVLQNGLVTTEYDQFELKVPEQSTGNCSKIVSFMEVHQVPYLETYREKTWGIFYKTRTRWNYRTEFSRSWRKEYECCTGYKHTQRSKKYGGIYATCDPICQPDCGNGTCISPNVCNCDYGYSTKKIITGSTEFDNFICAPVCTHSCINGKCVAPETCMCDSGYELSEDHYTCKPVCNVSCSTGSFCYKPNQCFCLSGYEMKASSPVNDSDNKSPIQGKIRDVFTKVDIATLEGITVITTSSVDKLLKQQMCQPICEKECVHGKCTAPNLCTCNDGYQPVLNDLFTCEPKCEHDCLFGRCTAPNVCTCNEGYSLKTPGVCEPICSKGCVMGTCVAPESCTCFAGYGLLESSNYICEPVCEKACLNGQCTVPGVCTCNEGFRLSGDETEKHICKPHCEVSCEPFGMCTAPDTCTCFEGYRLVNKTQAKKISSEYFADSSICEPVCNYECTNGFCSAPNICSCNDGYHASGAFIDNTILGCDPTCSQNCVNSVCSAPETCRCNDGYRPSNSSYVCEPYCDTDCVNGHCIAPNVCTCNSGYQLAKNSRSFCEPICNPSCKNAVCVQPDVCSCNSGYRRSTSAEANVCEPVCHPACEKTNGICEAPDHCVCKAGYRMVHYDDGGNVPFECEPICGVECGNGTCTAPDICACFDGYQNAKIGGCEPVCSTCSNGTCVAPEVCECDEGFVPAMLGLGAQKSPLAVAPGNETRNGSRCVPYCENCENGDCEAPGECRCHAGFVRIEDTCVHACQGGCGAHGECVETRRTCECDYGWAGRHCDRPTLCILILNDVGNHTEQLTIIEEQNATIEHVFMNNPACFECINKVNNESLCFKMFVNGTKDETQIGCLMNEECLTLSSQYKSQENMIKLTIGIASGILFLATITIYLILRKRRNRQVDLGSVQIICRHSESTQGLTESNATF